MLFNRHSGPGCPKCGGIVGPHSDFCLECNYDTATFTPWDWFLCLVFGGIWAWGMIAAAQ